MFADKHLYFIAILLIKLSWCKFAPTWESLDKRPLPSWYDEAKFGIFIHWGVFSVPSFGSEWFWKNWQGNSTKYVEFMNENFPPKFTYQDFSRDLTAEFYDPYEWAEIIKNSGARYVVLTSKHHEGYTLWPSKYSYSWNSMDTGPHKDLLGELAEAIRSTTNLKFGIYHSLYEWFNPLYLYDQNNNYSTQLFVLQKTIPELEELVMKYRPSVIWSDGDWETSDSYWNSREFLAWLYNESPVRTDVVVNDRWGKDIPCKHGDFFTCHDHYNPGVLQSHKWENCITVDRESWGYRRNAKLADYRTTKELLEELVETVSCGGNMLLNVGPTKEGTIPVIMQERLSEIGSWLNINGEAIYNTQPWSVQNDTHAPGVWYTMSGGNQIDIYVYAIIFEWPTNGILQLTSPRLLKDSNVMMVGTNNSLQWKEKTNAVEITFPDRSSISWSVWCLKMNNVKKRKLEI